MTNQGEVVGGPSIHSKAAATLKYLQSVIEASRSHEVDGK